MIVVAQHDVMPRINRKHLTPIEKVNGLQVQKRDKFAERQYKSAKWYKYSRDTRGANPVCAMCNGVFPMFALVVDHIIPVRFGGSFSDTRNHQVLCTNCHNHKTATEKTKSMAQGQLNDNNELIPL